MCFTKHRYANRERRKDIHMSCAAPIKWRNRDLEQATESAVKVRRSAQARCLGVWIRHQHPPGNWHSGGPFQALVDRCLRWGATPTTGCFQSKTTTKTAAVKTASTLCPCQKVWSDAGAGSR